MHKKLSNNIEKRLFKALFFVYSYLVDFQKFINLKLLEFCKK